MDGAAIQRRRDRAEAQRQRRGEPHVVEVFHQLDDPYSHLSAQVLATFAERYDVVIKFHLIRASGGASQPEFEKLAAWARRDAALIAPHLGLTFPTRAETVPHHEHQLLAARWPMHRRSGGIKPTGAVHVSQTSTERLGASHTAKRRMARCVRAPRARRVAPKPSAVDARWHISAPRGARWTDASALA